MEVRAISERGRRGGGEAELRLGGRGFQDERHGWRAAEGRDEEAEARDGAPSSLACMLPETAARVQPGV